MEAMLDETVIPARTADEQSECHSLLDGRTICCRRLTRETWQDAGTGSATPNVCWRLALVASLLSGSIALVGLLTSTGHPRLTWLSSSVRHLRHENDLPSELTSTLPADTYEPLFCNSGGHSGPDIESAVSFYGAVLPRTFFTLAVSFRSSKTGVVQDIAAWSAPGSASAETVELRLGPSGNLEYGERQNGWNSVFALPNLHLADGVWHSVAVVRNEWGLVSLFSDGMLVGKGVVPPQIPMGLEPVAKSARQLTGDSVFNGDVANLRIFDVVLRPGQLKGLAGRGCRTTTPRPSFLDMVAQKITEAAKLQEVSTPTSTTTTTTATSTTTHTLLPSSTNTQTLLPTTTSKLSSPAVAVPVATTTSDQRHEAKFTPKFTPRIYCFALMMPGGNETVLMNGQLERNMGIFSCDGCTLFSNISMLLGHFHSRRIQTRIVHGALKVPTGGQYLTALNTDVFVKVWHAVVREGKFKKFDWTIKVDPDTVFFPSRLRDLLAKPPMSDLLHGPVPCDSCDAELQRAMYLNSCQFGLHGSLEVLSRGAVVAFISGLQKCDALRQLPWGEAWFLDHCLPQLGVRREHQRALLDEERCGQHPEPCEAPRVAFHPFKAWNNFQACHEHAKKAGSWP